MTLSLEQLQERRTGIAGSDAAAVLELSPWSSPWDVWCDKTGLAPLVPFAETEPMRWGSLLENVIAAEYWNRTGIRIEKRTELLRHPIHAFLIGHPDFLAVDDPELGLEIKAVGSHQSEHWGPPGTDEIPVHYLLQCVHYMVLTGRSRWDVAVLVGGQELRIYHLQLDRELAWGLVDAEQEFWGLVQRGEPPELDGSPACRRYLQERFQRTRRSMGRPANPLETELAVELESVRRDIDGLEFRRRATEAAIMFSMGDSDRIFAGWGSINWRFTETGSRPFRATFHRNGGF